MADRTSKIIIAKNIKLDKNYVNVINYTEQQMLDLVTANKVYEKDNFSFIRKEKNVISVDIPYFQAIRANYMAFQNPDYSHKWFFAFIDDVEYVSDNNVKIHFQVDAFSTFFKFVNLYKCFVKREHVNDDTIGKNILDENLSVDNVECYNQQEIPNLDKMYLIVENSYTIITGSDGTESSPSQKGYEGRKHNICK